MDNKRHIHHSGRHFGFSYPVSLWQRLHSAFAPLLLIVVLFAILSLLSIFPIVRTPVSFLLIGKALLATFARLGIAYCLALICAVPLAILVNRSPLMERILLPLFDVAQSIPVLAFFPIVIILFVRFGFLNAAAIFILFITMLWSIVFNLVGGIKVIPSDIKDAAHVFGIRGRKYVQKILLPATVPYLVTGSLLAWAGGWNIVIVAEVLHTYIPGGTSGQDLFGIGSVLVNASANGQNVVFVAAIIVMVAFIGLLNFFIWQKLLRYAERFKFE